MATISPTRPARRAARRNIILDEESEDELSLFQEDEDDFTPAPKKASPRKTARRQTTANLDISPKKSARGRRAKTGENIEPSQIFDPDVSIAPTETISPTKKASPRKRTSTAVPRKSRRSSAVPEVSTLPTPAPSISPEPQSWKSTPLADITEKINNRSSPPVVVAKQDVKKIQPIEAVLETPMELMAKAKAQPVQVVEEPIGTRSRMVIKQLAMTNFKSYAGRQIVGPFHVSFSSVVGPNGSGKSNVIDSLLFVFGFRASKMRQGKISALIHNSVQHQDLDFCEVEVHFQEIVDLPGGKHEVVPESAMVVSRRAFKNNSSNYYLNGRTTNFTAVTTLLKDKGIDLDHKRFLILQGEVESIAQMKPKAANEHDDGLLEYLEDIIGTSRYKTPIEEGVVEVEDLNEVCVEKQSRVQHVEKEKNGLEDKKNKALTYVRDENELAEKQATLYQIYIAECEDNHKVTEEAIQQMQAHLDAELAKHAGSEESIKTIEKRYKKEAKGLEQMEQTTQSLIKDLAKFEKESVKFEEKKKFISGKQKKADKATTASRLSASECRSLVAKYTEDIERKTAEIEKLEASLKKEEVDLAEIRESLKGKTEGLSAQIAAKQKSLEPWNEKISQKQSAVAVTQSELDILQEKASSGAKATEEAQAKANLIRELRQTKESEIADYQHKKARAEKEIRKLQDALSKLARTEPEVRTQIASARQKAEEARSSLATTQNQGSVLKGLLRLKDSGRIDGFYGQLGNLGTIDDKYDVAISTACPSLANMVVDSVDVGQQCIDYLRKNNLGRANFILLDKLAKRDLAPIQTPENVPRLFDLVRAKHERFGPAFYSVMQNTLVAKDLEQANRIAYGAKRWRVVTLDGQLIDVSGTMSGGGTKVARGAMSSKLVAETTKEQVVKLEADRDDLEKQFDAFLEKQRELEGTLKERQEEIPIFDTTMQKINLEIESLARNLADAERRLQELDSDQENSKTDDAQLKGLEKQIFGLEKEIAKLHDETSSVEAEIEDLQAKIMEVGGVRLRGQKAKVDGLKEQIDQYGNEISNAEVDKTKNEKLVAKHEKAKEASDKELAGLEKDLEKLEADITTHSKSTSGMKAQAEKAQEALETKKEELTTLKTQLDQETSELNSSRAVEIEMRNKLEENQKILADNNKKGRYWTEKLSKLTLHDIADLEGRAPTSALAVEASTQRDEYAMDEDSMDIDEPETSAQTEPAQSSNSTPQLPTFTRDELLDKSKDHLVASIAALEEKISTSTSIDLSVISEYRRRCEDLRTRTDDLNSALSTRDSAKSRLTELRHLRLSNFMTGFTTISSHLKTMYQMITMGGNAELELVDSLDPFSEGILFSVMPPKKSWKNIGNLSGGEKTLSSLALVFALHVYRPTPLYVMDEIDAALDFRNVRLNKSAWQMIDANGCLRCRLSQAISRRGRRMLSSLSFPCAIICLSWRRGWLGSIKSTI